jgi:tetratricopeptide (TPR) repeat protein
MHPARACGELERKLGHRDRAKELYERAHAIAVDTYGPRHEEVARALDGLAALHLDADELAEADALLRDALSIARDALGERDAFTETLREQLAVIEAEGAKPRR